MGKSQLYSLLSRIVPLSEHFERVLTETLIPLSLPNRYMLLEAPKVSDHAYYIESGYVMSFSFYKGRKQVDGFYGSGQIVFSPKSFFDQVPSVEFLQVMTGSEFLCISYANMVNLLSSFKEANIIQRALMIEYYQRERERIDDMRRLDTVGRHQKLLKTFPKIEQLVPQESIASYLGITPQTLSRIKKESSGT
jgi:CRP-like cAMP-binding protein